MVERVFLASLEILQAPHLELVVDKGVEERLGAKASSRQVEISLQLVHVFLPRAKSEWIGTLGGRLLAQVRVSHPPDYMVKIRGRAYIEERKA